jgi:hypothetical protein
MPEILIVSLQLDALLGNDYYYLGRSRFVTPILRNWRSPNLKIGVRGQGRAIFILCCVRST